MKNLLCLLLLLSVLSPTTQAQITLNKISPDTFRIQKFPLRYFYAGEKMRKPKQLESILLSKNDLQINRDWKAAKTTRSVGTGVMVLGLVLEGLGLIKTAKGDEGGASLLLGGAGVMLGGLVIGIFANRPTERAMNRFNGIQTGQIIFPELPESKTPDRSGADKGPKDQPAEKTPPTPGKKAIADKPCPCIGIRSGLNSSKLWEIGGSDELKPDEKIWWAKSLPIALFYEIPGVTAGHSILLELALASKGFRIITKTTNPNGSTRSRSDLQMRFLQLSALKKLPIGAQDKKLRLHGQGGVFLGYAITARQKTRSVQKNDVLKKWTRSISKYDFGDNAGQLNAGRFDAGLVLGAGASYPLGPGRISLDARFSMGAINLEKAKSNDPKLKFPSLHTRDLVLLLGYSVPIAAR